MPVEPGTWKPCKDFGKHVELIQGSRSEHIYFSFLFL